MRTDDFAYDLPADRIAQHPLEPRDACRLLVLDRATGAIQHRTFRDVGDYLTPGDVLVVNETRVLPARLLGNRTDTGGKVELLLLKELKENTWESLTKPAKQAKPGTQYRFSNDHLSMTGTVVATGTEGLRHIHFTPAPPATFSEALHALGTTPLPPYIKQRLDDAELYQTVYAHDEHSAAAPTAGLHFTPQLLAAVQKKGVTLATVRLDVGLDTFRPVTEDDPTHHHIHTEYYAVPPQTQAAITQAHAEGHKVIATGTTVVRALESAAVTGRQSGSTSLYILPGYDFQVIDALISNFHVPRSTLLMLVSALATRDHILTAYQEALAADYRFLSFGDAMFIH